MRKTHLQWILGFPVVFFLGAVGGCETPATTSTPGCVAQAQVRAPDLTPGAILHGDARVKISPDCPAIQHVLLGLRFKERSFIRALRSREDAEWLNPESVRYGLPDPLPRIVPPRFANKSVEEAREEIFTNGDLWIVREEERLVFETTQSIDMEDKNHGALRDAVQNFSIFVPSTNFPPVLDIMNVIFPVSMGPEIVDIQWIYEYFAEISFSNGTTREIQAGFTAFQPLHDPARASQGLTSATVKLQPWGDTGEKSANYSIQISADSGLTFVAGKTGRVVTAVISRTGFARTFSAPLNVFMRVIPDSPSSNWAAECAVSDVNSVFVLASTSVLRTPLDDDEKVFNKTRSPRPRRRNASVTVTMPNSTSDEIQAHAIVTTTSAAFTMSIDVDDVHIPTFETYYQTLANALMITLETPRGRDEDVDPDDPPSEPEFGLALSFEDDEEPRVVWEEGIGRPRIWRSYSERVPAVVHPARERTLSQDCVHASADIPGQAVALDEMGCKRHSLIHYLEKGARGPTFVDRSVIDELIAENPAGRELRAPFLKPVTSSPPEGEELVSYYYSAATHHKPPIYVGETWVKEMVSRSVFSPSDAQAMCQTRQHTADTLLN